MARKKKKKHQQQKQHSPAAYLRTQARKLPLQECLITQNWQEVKVATIVVTRQHNSGNFTSGIFLVDLECLGVKKVNWRFNLLPHEYQAFREKILESGLEGCDYVVAHNVIYGAIAFAEEFGLRPHKDFKIVQGILEEDDEKIEMMEIEFGTDGRPHLIVHPGEDRRREIRLLDQHLGRENYHLTLGFEDEAEFESEKLETSPSYPSTPDMNGLNDPHNPDSWEEAKWDEFMEKPNEYSLPEQARAYDLLYRALYHSLDSHQDIWEEAWKKFAPSDVQWSNGHDHPHYHPISDETASRLKEMELLIHSGSPDYVQILEELIAEQPRNPFLLFMAVDNLWLQNNLEEAEAMLRLGLDRFPDFLPLHFRMASLKIQGGDLEGGLAFLNGSFNLSDHAPGQTKFIALEAIAALSTAIQYHTIKDEHLKASMYYDWLWKLFPDHPESWLCLSSTSSTSGKSSSLNSIPTSKRLL